MIVATAGHVDHGKTALVKALTGVDTDRLPQEKARGISIDLGFAYATTPGGATLGFVDVPGHERFVRNMVAGVCGIDYVLLLVAADDGVMPQTREHLAIVDLLAVAQGIVVVSKVDCASPDRIEQVRAEITSAVAGTGLEGADIVEVSALTGQGMEALRRRLEAAADAHSRAFDARRGFRYAIDRAFSVAGSGTVVTGTVFHGQAKVGDRLKVSPSGMEVRVRGIQKAGVAAQGVQAGERCALNLAGVERNDVGRGQWIIADDATTTRMDVELRMLADAEKPLRHWTPVHLHIGTADVGARVAIARARSIPPGESALVQIVCDAPVSAVVGDRFIVRDPSATQTLGGGVVLDPFAPSRRVVRADRTTQLDAYGLRDPERALSALLAASPAGVDLAQFARAFNLTPGARDRLAVEASAVVIATHPPRVLRAAAVDAIRNAVIVTLARFHADSPQAPGIEMAALRREAAPALSAETFAALLRAAATDLRLEMSGSIVRRAGHVATANRADEVLWQRLKPRLVEAGFRGRLLRDLADDTRVRESVLSDFLHRKAATGELVRVTPQRFYPREVMADFAAVATAMAAEAPDATFIAAQFRDRTGINRTLAIEVLECLDRLGITQRVGDARKMRKDFVPILGASSAPRAPMARSGRSQASRAAH
jgi:selenocysteine-specific elongation factor